MLVGHVVFLSPKCCFCVLGPPLVSTFSLRGEAWIEMLPRVPCLVTQTLLSLGSASSNSKPSKDKQRQGRKNVPVKEGSLALSSLARQSRTVPIIRPWLISPWKPRMPLWEVAASPLTCFSSQPVLVPKCQNLCRH